MRSSNLMYHQAFSIKLPALADNEENILITEIAILLSQKKEVGNSGQGCHKVLISKSFVYKFIKLYLHSNY
jgi:hypothetical protein